MSILPKLISAYRSAGYDTLTGYNPYHFGGWMDAPFTRLVWKGDLQGCPGLALQEVMMLEGFSDYLKPRNILVVGNAQGWSTLALSLIFPEANVVGIDPVPEGNALTNLIAEHERLRVKAVDGYSPQDVAGICAANLSGPLDLVLIDAVHSNEAVLTDFAACLPLAHENTVWVFHDVINWGLVEAITQIRAEHGLAGNILTRTPSGMAVLWKNAPADFQEYISAFCEDFNLYYGYRDLVLRSISEGGDQAAVVSQAEVAASQAAETP